MSQGDQPDGELHEAAASWLNIIVKELEVYGKHLWRVEEVLTKLELSSQVTNDGETYYCIRSHTAAAENEPGTGAKWEDYWYKGEIEAATSTAWALTTEYTRGGEIDVEDGTSAIEIAYYRYNDIDKPVPIINRFQEADIEEKWLVGRPDNARYDRTANKLYIYPLPQETYSLVYFRVRVLEDMDEASGNPDTPKTLLSYLIFELANMLAEQYDQSEEKILRLATRAQGKLALSLKKQVEDTDEVDLDPTY